MYCIGQNQPGLNEDAAKHFQKADRELNTVYHKILKEYAPDRTFIKNLKAAQKIWIRFREAETKVKYPEREAGYYGSVQPMCRSNYRALLTEERTEKLNVWLTGIEEGDACAGSVKNKN